MDQINDYIHHINNFHVDILIPILAAVEDPPKIKGICTQWYSYGNDLYKHIFARLGFHLSSKDQDDKNSYALKDLVLKIFDPNPIDKCFWEYGNEYKRGTETFASSFKNMWKRVNNFHENKITVDRVASTKASEGFHPCCVYVNPWTGFEKAHTFCRLNGGRNLYATAHKVEVKALFRQ